MKKLMIVILVLMAITLSASADVLVGPMIALSVAAILLPILLVVGLVALTVVLIRRMRKK